MTTEKNYEERTCAYEKCNKTFRVSVPYRDKKYCNATCQRAAAERRKYLKKKEKTLGKR